MTTVDFPGVRCVQRRVERERGDGENFEEPSVFVFVLTRLRLLFDE